MPKFDFAQLYGGTKLFEFPSTDPQSPIRIFAHVPSEVELMLALEEAGLDAQNAQNANPMAHTKFLFSLARHCIEKAENLDGWPTKCLQPSVLDTQKLIDDAWNLLPPPVRIKIGKDLANAAKVPAGK